MPQYQHQLPVAHRRATANTHVFIHLFLLTLLFVACINPSGAQVTIKGRILNSADGSPLPAVTIMEKGTKNGTTSDTEGNFSIAVSKLPAKLVFAYVGFDHKETTVKDSVKLLDIKLTESTASLEEVVVVGYGTTDGYERDEYVPAPSSAVSGRAKASTIAPGIMHTEKSRGSARAGETDYKTEAKELSGKKTVTDKVAKRTSLLTAGEVNDFKKWKMWEDYNEGDFKIHSDKWKLYATERYSVQLQNSNFKAIVGETIYLVDKDTKEVLWTAVSDNTGKAELWNGFSGNSGSKNVVLEIKGEKTSFPATPFSQGINHIQLRRSCTASSKVEISFVVDATGSMGDEIEYLKEELGDILTTFSTKEPSLELFTSAVFYRDKGDEYVTRVQPFSNNISSTIDFIKAQAAGGGGDYPEALKEALEEATNKLEWSTDARARIIFLLMDAPPHEEEKTNMAILIAKAAASGIRIVPVACSGTDKATEFIMRSMALATNGTYLFLTDDSGIGGAHIKPTTDEFKVELLNDLLQRTMEQMCFVNTCDEKNKTAEPVSLYTNNENVKVFPNPARGPVTLETDKELSEIFVADFTGKILMRLNVKDVKKQYRIDLSAFPSATYFIRYITKDNKTGAEKLVLLH